jgi:hypothetical protein
MKKWLVALVLCLGMSTAAQAQYRLIVPQAPGGGTSVWASVMAPHLSRTLGEPVIVEHIPGANDVPGFNRFHNELQRDAKTIMVAHGGNAESFLTDRVDYNYRDYAPIALVNLNIVVSHRRDFNPYQDTVRFGSTSGRRPDVMAIVMLICGPQPTLDAYIDCYKRRVIFVKGMKPTDARLAALRGELNVTRETFVSHKKFIEPQTQKGVFNDWFHHGVLDITSGINTADRNFATLPTFEQEYRRRWGQQPQGDFYDAYRLVRSYRDVLQKSLWVGRDNPNATRIRAAVQTMLADPEAREAIERDGGDYDWIIGDNMMAAYNTIGARITERSLRTLYEFTERGMGLEAVWKPELIVRGRK